MADVIDQAQEREEVHREQALARYRRQRGAVSNADPSPRDCAACGDPIPIERLRAVPSAIRCIDCVRELQAGGFR